MPPQRPQKAPRGPDTDSLTERQRRALAALLAAPTAKQAAERAGLSERQMKRYRADPVFRAAYQEAQTELLDRAVNQSRQHLIGALSVLSEIAEDVNAPPAARVSAARASVELALKLGEQADVLARLDALEQQALKEGL